MLQYVYNKSKEIKTNMKIIKNKWPKNKRCCLILTHDMETKTSFDNIEKIRRVERKYNLKFTGNEILFVQHSITTKSNKSKYEISQTLNALKKLKIPTIAISPNSDAGHQEIFDVMEIFSKKHDFFKIHW